MSLCIYQLTCSKNGSIHAVFYFAILSKEIKLTCTLYNSAPAAKSPHANFTPVKQKYINL